MKVTDFYYNGEQGYTCTELFRDGEYFIGEARCHPDDVKYKSETIGKDLSYMRAALAIQKEDLALKKEEVNIIENFVKSLECYKNFNQLENDESAKCVYRQLNRRRREVAAAAYEIKVSNWIINEICTKGSKLDDVLLKLESAIDKGVI